MKKKLMQDRKFMTQAVTLALLAVVSTFQACGPGQLSKDSSSTGNELDGINLTSGEFIAGPGGSLVPLNSTKTVGVSHSENVLSSLVSMSGIGVPSATVVTRANAERTKIAEGGTADGVNAPMMMAITNIAGEVCWDLVARNPTSEKAVTPAQRRIFGQINFAAGPDMVSDSALDDVIRRLARSAWARNETDEERATLKQAIRSNFIGTVPADTDRAMLFTCTAMLSSLDAHDR